MKLGAFPVNLELSLQEMRLDCAASSGSTFEMASVVSNKPIKKTIKKFRKHKHKIPQLMTEFN